MKKVERVEIPQEALLSGGESERVIIFSGRFTAFFKTLNSQDRNSTEEEIDDIVTIQADEVAAWEQPVN